MKCTNLNVDYPDSVIMVAIKYIKNRGHFLMYRCTEHNSDQPLKALLVLEVSSQFIFPLIVNFDWDVGGKWMGFLLIEPYCCTLLFVWMTLIGLLNNEKQIQHFIGWSSPLLQVKQEDTQPKNLVLEFLQHGTSVLIKSNIKTAMGFTRYGMEYKVMRYG